MLDLSKMIEAGSDGKRLKIKGRTKRAFKSSFLHFIDSRQESRFRAVFEVVHATPYAMRKASY